MSNVTQTKIAAFREFAATLAGQVVEQLCTEFEREVSVMYNDLLVQRQELTRVAELLGHQLGREKQLHEMLDHMSAHHVSLASAAQQAAAMQPGSKDIHEALDRTMGQQVQIQNTVMQGMSQAHAVAQQTIANAKQLQEPLITAESEFNRIVQLLSVPMISIATPQPTAARFPNVQPIGQPAKISTPPMSPYAASGGTAPFPQPGTIAGGVSPGASPARHLPSPRNGHAMVQTPQQNFGQQRPVFS